MMENHGKGAITQGWSIFLATIAVVSLIGTPSLASLTQRNTPSSSSPQSYTTQQVIGTSGGSPHPLDGSDWMVTLNFEKQGSGHTWDNATFGEKTDALDAKDAYDIPKPGCPPHPYIYAWFDAGLSSPYDKLWYDYRHYPHVDVTWDLWVHADTNGPSLGTTNVLVSWSSTAVKTSEYTQVNFCTATGTVLADMKTASSLLLSDLADDTSYHYKIVCHVNQAPVVDDIPGQTVDEGSSFATISLDDYVSDSDNTDAQMTWSYSGNSALTVSIDSSRVATITIPNTDWNGAETITFKATDPYGLWDDDAATFTVTAVNDPPTSADNTVATLEDTQYVFKIADFPFTDVDTGDSFQGIQVTATVSVGALKLNGVPVDDDDVVSAADISGGKLTFDPVLNGNGAGYDSFDFKVYDGHAYSGSAYTMTIDVTAQNDPPVVSGIPDQTINQGGSFAAFDLDDFVSDVDNSPGELTWQASGYVHFVVTIDDDHVVTISPDGWFGTETITFTAKDPDLAPGSDTASFTVLQYHTVALKTGWNLISLPVYDTITKTDIKVNYGGTIYTWAQATNPPGSGIILDFVYNWIRGSTQTYETVTTLAPGNGYWIWANHDCDLLIASNAAPPTNKLITDLQTKWDIMGLPYGTSLPKGSLDIFVDPTHYSWTEATTGLDPLILGFIYGWDSTNQLYTLENTFTPGHGYWMYAYHDCRFSRGD